MKKSQSQNIQEHIEKHGSITPMDALKYGCMRLAARAFELGLISTMERKNGKRYARYTAP